MTRLQKMEAEAAVDKQGEVKAKALWKLRHAVKTLRDVEVEAVVNKMHHSLAEVEAEKPVDTLRHVEGEASADTLADSLAEVKAEKVGVDGCERRITSFNAGHHAGRGGGQDGLQNTRRS